MEIMNIIGNLGNNAIIEEKGEQLLVKISIACSNRTKNKSGEFEDITTWYSVTWFVSKKRKDYITATLIKGCKVFICGDFVQEFFYNEHKEKKIRNHIFAHTLVAY